MNTEPNEVHNKPKLVTVFGGSGFVGRAVVSALTKRGYRVRVAVRRPEIAYYMQPLGAVGQIQLIQANIRHPWSIERALIGADYAINLVGIMNEKGKQRFNSVQVQGAKTIAEACKKAGIALTHVSALAADPTSSSAYSRTKAEGEKAVRSVLPDTIIMRPSAIFGADDTFFNRFADMARFTPFMPLIGGGNTMLQPVFIDDVAEAIALSVDGKLKAGATYELAGPESRSIKEWMMRTMQVIGRKRIFFSMPWWLAKLTGSIMGILPKPALTRDQVELLRKDYVLSDEAKHAGLTLEGIGIKPQAPDAIMDSYLWRYRLSGQYANLYRLELKDEQ